MEELWDPVIHSSVQAQERMKIARYTCTLYKYYLLVAQGTRADGEAAPVPPPGISAELKLDCEAAGRMLAQAVRNKLAWDAQRYADRLGNGTTLDIKQEDELFKRYPPLGHRPGVEPKPEEYGVISQPAVITDCHGNLLIWSLPGIISERRQATLLAATRCLEVRLRIYNDDDIKHPGQKWRIAQRFFTTGVEWTSGLSCFSPAWFQQGHKDRPYGTRILKEADGIAWMAAWLESGGLLDGILAVTHPALYKAGLEAEMRLSARAPELREQIEKWPTAFNCIQLLVNRLTCS
ncbi:hypothetical protein C8T65DRAFT_746924 [Cerioporus squamosus]|nr:hypothetical protein C8T65DRAFT_746924 [Cerioporus squamosus]